MSVKSNSTRKVAYGLLVACVAVMFSAYTPSLNNEKAAIACFEFQGGDSPDETQVIINTDYVMTPLNCEPNPETLCSICFDTVDFPLVGGLPNLNDPFLKEILQTKGLDKANDGLPFSDPIGRTVTLHFRDFR